MRFLLDECCDTPLIAALRRSGHDVLSIAEVMPGASDNIVLKLAFDEARILVTEDKDFGELVYRLRRPAFGVILLRFDIGEELFKTTRLLELTSQPLDRLKGMFVVVESDRVRLRPLLPNK